MVLEATTLPTVPQPLPEQILNHSMPLRIYSYVSYWAHFDVQNDKELFFV